MSNAYIQANPFLLTGFTIIDITTTGYKWYFPSDEPRILEWTTSSSRWNHPKLYSTENQSNFTLVFAAIEEFIDIEFVFKGYVSGFEGYKSAYQSGSNLNISFSYDGLNSSGVLVKDGFFNSTSATAFCNFPSSSYDSPYLGAAGDTWLNYNNPFIKSLTFEQGTDGHALILHEILHGLGLKHPHDDGGTGRPTYSSKGIQWLDRQWVSVMSYDKHENGGDGAYIGSQPIGPMIFDAIALQYLYGESKFNSGNTNYDLSRYLGNYYNCQWDYSGIDTLDGSSLSYGIVAELGISSEFNGQATHNIGYITTFIDYLFIDSVNPDKWTWLWGEYENVNGTLYSDRLTGNSDNNVINGGGGDDYLVGGEGSDTFDWDPALRAGADTMAGGKGDDIYVIDSIYDQIVELAYEGVDTVYVGFNFSLENTGLENIGSFAGSTAPLILTGNSWGNQMSGAGGNDTIYGNEGDDQIYGNGAADSIWGGSGSDIINGGEGVDTAYYSSGYSNYVVSKTVDGYLVVSRLTGEGTDNLTSIERLSFTDRVGSIDGFISAPDATAPTASTFSPADEATAVAIGVNLVVTFSEAIQRGAGNIVLKKADGTTVATYAQSSTEVTVSGSTLTINPASDLAYGTGYKVEFSAGSVKDVAGNSYTGISTYDFTTAAAPDNTAPTVTTFSPTDGATAVLVSANIVVTFSEAIQKGTGNIVLKDAANNVAATYDAATSSNLSISGSTLTINPTADLGYSTNYFVTFASGTIKDLAGNSYTGISTYDFTTVAAPDTTPPAMSMVNPVDGATGVLIGSNFVLTFNESVKAGTGNFLVKTGGTTFATIAVTDAIQVSFSGNTVTINPSNDLQYSTAYTVEIASGVITDTAGNAWAGNAGNFYDFTTAAAPDTTAPIVSNFSPTDGATGVLVGANIVLTFSETIQKGTGSIVLKDAANVVVATYDAATSSNLSTSGSTLTINPTADLAFSTNYFVTFASGSIKDLAGNSYSGITTYDFTTAAAPDTTAPTVATFSPTDGATAVLVGANIVVTFSEAIQKGTGNIVLKDAANTVIATYDAATSSNLSISGSTLTINPTADLGYSTNYFVTFASGTIKDLAGNSYTGISTYDFTTAAAPDTTAPSVTTFSPTDGATAVLVGANIVVTFSEAIQKGTGNIVLKDAANNVVATYDAATSSNLNISGSTLTINPTADLGYSTNYFVTFASGTIKDLAGNSFSGITTYDFTTAAPPDTTAPTVTAFSPTDGATAVLVGANIVVTFSEAIQKGTGNIVLKDAANNVVATYDAATSTNLSISGSTLTINPTADLGYSTNYFVTFASGSIKDLAGNSYSGISTYDFTTAAAPDTIAPTVQFSDNQSGTVNLASLSAPSIIYTLTFSEAVTGLDASDITLNVGKVTAVAGSGSSWTVTVGTGYLFTGKLQITLKAGAVTDAAGNANALASDNSQAMDTEYPLTPSLSARGVTGPLVDPQVRFDTTLGSFTLELDPELAPLSTANMLGYVQASFYNNTLFHRIVNDPVPSGMQIVQGGGLTAGMVTKTTGSAIALESDNGLSNVRGSVAMARGSGADTGTSQFFINVQDNLFLDYVNQATPQYAVFGQVVAGMDVIDAMAAKPVKTVGA